MTRSGEVVRHSGEELGNCEYIEKGFFAHW